MVAQYPKTISTDLHVAQALRASAQSGNEDAFVGALFNSAPVSNLCVKNWALQRGVDPDCAVAVSLGEKRATRFMAKTMKADPQIAAAWDLPWEPDSEVIPDAAIAKGGVEELRYQIRAFEKDCPIKNRRIEVLEFELDTAKARGDRLASEKQDADRRCHALSDDNKSLHLGFLPASWFVPLIQSIDRNAWKAISDEVHPTVTLDNRYSLEVVFACSATFGSLSAVSPVLRA